MESVVRLNKRSREVLETYGSTANSAINGMGIRISSLEAELKTKQAVTEALQKTGPVSATDKWKQTSQIAPDGGLKLGDVSEKEFWKRMKTELDTTIQSYAGRT